MNYPMLSLVAGLIGATIFLFSRWSYRQEREAGHSHQESIRDSAALHLFLVGSAAFDYVAVVSRYS